MRCFEFVCRRILVGGGEIDLDFLSDFMGRRKRIILTVVYFGLFQINVFK